MTLRFTASGDKQSRTRDGSEEMEDSDWLGRRNHTPGWSLYVIPGNGAPRHQRLLPPPTWATAVHPPAVHSAQSAPRN